MGDAYSRVMCLLERWRTLRAKEQGASPEPLPKEAGESRILTLQDGAYKPLSPMLRARFDFASRWEDAYLLQMWMGLNDIENYQSNDQLVRWISLRRENWETAPPASVGADQCAVFGYDPYEPDETYLVWKEGVEEPGVWQYFGAENCYFHDFERFLEYIVGDRPEDDLDRLYSIWVRVISSPDNRLEQVAARRVEAGIFKLVPEPNHESFALVSGDWDPQRDRLEFSEGDVVRCEERRLSDTVTGFLAVEKVSA
jgi:hypothetical protein